MKRLILAATLLAAGGLAVPADAATQSNCPPGQQGSAGNQTCAEGTLGGPATGATSSSSTTTGETGTGATTVVPDAGMATGTGDKTGMGGGSSSRLGGATESTQ